MEEKSGYSGEKMDEIHSKAIRAGRRTYFFDVRETKAGDYYLTITESKKFTNEDGSYHYKKHKIYLYKEDFEEFTDTLKETIDFIFEKKGVEVISERHRKDFQPQEKADDETPKTASDFSDVKFEDI